MGTVFGGLGKPPGDGFENEIDFQSLFSKHDIYKHFHYSFDDAFTKTHARGPPQMAVGG